MSTYNMASIKNKVDACLKKPQYQIKINKIIDDVVHGKSMPRQGSLIIGGAKEGAEKFIEVLQKEVINLSGMSPADGGLGPTAVNTLTSLSSGNLEKIGRRRYKIDIWFNDDLTRQSLSPNKYEDIDNIAALLNSGYTAGHTVHGVWKGHSDYPIASLTSRGGAHFLEKAIDVYMHGYAKQYGVIDIKLDSDYK